MHFYPRLAALLTIFLWSSAALLILGLGGLPPCLLLACSSTIGLVLTATFLTLTDRWRALVPLKNLLLPASALVIINQICYVLAFRAAPAAQVDLINYLWPSMLVLLTGKFIGRYTGYLVVALGAGGVSIALEPSAIESRYLVGYIAALGAALSWTAFSLLVRKHNMPPEFLSLTVGVGAPVFWALHLIMGEPALSVSLQEAALLVCYGGGVYVLAYLSWGYALKHGSAGEAGALCYLIPLLSIIGLALFGYIDFTPRISWATVLIVAAAIVPMLDQWFGAKEDSSPIGDTLKAA